MHLRATTRVTAGLLSEGNGEEEEGVDLEGIAVRGDAESD